MSRSWQCPHSCLDVAVTDEGTLLVAAVQLGLKECDTSGKELHCWKPTRQEGGGDEYVLTVDVLDDGRAAVGLFASRLVALLHRCSSSDGAWLEDKRVAVLLQSPPRRLAVHGNLLAACENRLESENNRWWRGPQLVLVKLCCGTELYRRKLEYDICSVAVTAKLVVTSSNSAVKLSDGREKYVVDGYSHSGDRLWRHESINKFTDICPQPFGRVLYLGVSGVNVVMASGIDGGQNLEVVLACGSHAGKGLYALSLAKGKQSVLAVLSIDDKLTVYPASSST